MEINIYRLTGSTKELIIKNIDQRSGCIAKFYGWLQANIETPIEVKLLILDNCLFLSMLYGIEAWGNFDCVDERLRKIEVQALKAILEVKRGTATDLVYHELRRPNIVSRVKDQQYKFFKRINSLNEDIAIVVSIMRICQGCPMLMYYESLHNHHGDDDMKDRELRIQSSTLSSLVYYSAMNFSSKSMIYQSFMDDEKRAVISRWRLSNHRLKIETLRYHRPLIQRKDRLCDVCGVLDDETHAVYECIRYNIIREKYVALLTKLDSIQKFLNPGVEDMLRVASFLMEVEKILK